MPLKRLPGVEVLQSGKRHAIVLILLALLTMVSVLALSAERVAGAKKPAAEYSSRISQADNAPKLAKQGKELYEAGQFEEAAEVWQQAAAAYAQVGDFDGMTRSRINTAEALQALGFYPRACNTLLQAFGISTKNCQNLIQENENYQQRDSLLKTLSAQPNSLNKAVGLLRLGEVLQRLDDLELSTKVLWLSLNVAQKLHSPKAESTILLTLGNTYHSWGNRARALQYTASESRPTPWRCLYTPSIGAPKKFYSKAASFYQQATTEFASPITWVQAQLNRLIVLLQSDEARDAQDLWPQIQSRIKHLPFSRAAVYAQINLAGSLRCLKQATAADTPSWGEIAQILATAAQQAQSLSDQRAESYALGYLGGLYAQTQKQPSAQDLTYAQNLTQQALNLAQAIKATDITYLWQWQLGLLLRNQGDIKGAIANYTAAVNSLQSLRSDLVASSSNAQFSFRESVEPVYRQLVDLLLRSEETSQENINQARDVIEALQLAQLENLLKCNLQTASPVPIDREIDSTAAVIYPIVLDDRIEVILSLYRQPLLHYSKPLPKEQNIEDLLDKLHQSLQAPDSAGPGFLKFSQQVYSWLVEPISAELEKSYVETLVFVLDEPLRNIPMAALHDGQHYLIEKYAVALSPSLQLLEPSPLSKERLFVLAAGISQKIPGFPAPALPEVKEELERISEVTKSVMLSEQEFTRVALQDKINERPFSVVHLATHGQFSSQPDETYIQAWDGRININELKTLLQTREQRIPDPIELLVLSACQTANGDKRAALGLAGVAVRAGARSTLATLWAVDDNSTALLMAQFYKTLSNRAESKVTKAKALQSAQLELLHNFKSPSRWAPYVLVGNWL